VMGVQFLGMGLIAEIMVRTYFESRHRASYVIADRIGFAAPAADAEQTAAAPVPRPALTYVAGSLPRLREAR